MNGQELFTLETLAAFPGLVVVTWMITQFTKDWVDWVAQKAFNIHPKTETWSYFVAVFLLIAVAFFQQNISGLSVFLGIINGFLVALAAQKIHDTILDETINKVNSMNKETNPS
jgi:xanthine/uracil permease